MILVSKAGYWYLAIRSQSDPDICGLRVGANMPMESGFEPRAAGRYCFKAVRIDDPSIKFYPEILFRSLKVHPEQWHPETAEPLLRCHLTDIMPAVAVPDLARAREELDQEAAERHVTVDDPLFLRWKKLVERQSAAGAALHARLVAEGWADGGREGLKRYLHIDELEKIEGPPPEGPF